MSPEFPNLTPISCGFTDLDDLLEGGLRRGDLVVLSGRTGVGKSMLAINVAANVARSGLTVGVSSLESSQEQLLLRIIAAEVGIDTHRLRCGLISTSEETRIMDSYSTISDLQLYFQDTKTQYIARTHANWRQLMLQRGLDLVIVDYLQLFQGTSFDRETGEQSMSEVSGFAKWMACDLNVPVLAISQMSLAREVHHFYPPQLSDLDEEGNIADVVVFIHRADTHFSQEDWELPSSGRASSGDTAEIIVAKNRHGAIGSTKLMFEGNLARFRIA